MPAAPLIGIERRHFLRTALVAGAGVASGRAWAAERSSEAALLSPRPSMIQPARSCIFVHLAGGVAQTDTWDPKPHTPLRRGMPLRSLGSTCQSIPTAAPAVRLAQGLEEIASVMDRGCVVRTIVGSSDAGTHAHAPDLFAALTSSDGPETDASRPSVTSLSFREMPEALRLACEGPCWCRVEHPLQPFDGFDTHDHGGLRMARLRGLIDGPIAELVRGLEARGVLERTLVVVTSEFGRTVGPARHHRWSPPGIVAADCSARPCRVPVDAWLERATVEDEADYGFHAHFAACSAALLFGGGVRRGVAWGRTAAEHPMVPVEDAVPWASWCATVGALLGLPSRRGWGQVVSGLLERA